MHIYFVGIGGAGLSPMAQLALDCGYQVTGSDLSEGHGTREVQKRGIEVGFDQSGSYITQVQNTKPIDWIVYTAACKPDHKELEFARQHGIKSGKRDEFINLILKQKNLKMLAVAGTHGKTTTTAMTVWMFKELALPVSYLIGSNISFGPSAKYEEGSEYFVYEADEFDHNFLHFNPFASIITNIDYDHPDTYPTHTEYYNAFAQFITQNQQLVGLWQDSYATLNPETPDQIGVTRVFHPQKDDPYTTKYLNQIHLSGLHNRQNALLAVNLLSYLLRQNTDKLCQLVTTFPGTQRRMELIDTHLYSDYAHHPTEIAATLQLATEINGEIAVIYQPHQNLRQYEIKQDYAKCFDRATKVYWLPTYLSREDGREILTPAQLAIYSNNKNIIVSEFGDELRDQIKQDQKAGKTIIGMGAGSIDDWMRKNLLN
jgi:UDP-N-acetylmuramate--alanine ligase